MSDLNEKHKAEDVKLTIKQRLFCEYYVVNWNATEAAIKAGYSESSSRTIAHENLTKHYIADYIEEIQEDLSKLAGISQLSQLLEYKKIAYSSIAHFHNTWVDLTDFDKLTKDQKSCIESIDTKVLKRTIGDELIDVEQIKVKLYDKQRALDSINKMLGFNAPEEIKTEFTSKDNSIKVIVENKEQAEKINELLKKAKE